MGGNHNISIDLQGGISHTIIINQIEGKDQIVKKDLPKSENVVLDLSLPLLQQIQLFAGDKVKIVNSEYPLKRVWFGRLWEDYVYGREYEVWAVQGDPVTPMFEGKGQLTIEVFFTKFRDKPRWLQRISEDCTTPHDYIRKVFSRGDGVIEYDLKPDFKYNNISVIFFGKKGKSLRNNIIVKLEKLKGSFEIPKEALIPPGLLWFNFIITDDKNCEKMGTCE